ncbi:MAG TPA: alpha/beta fold hydrolase [Polyangia bacterium]|nr:alpha/beta fold hydrolase [Polyangia bacterium]
MARAGVRALSAIAPPLGDRLAMDLFYRPRRKRLEPEVPDIACHRWRVQTRAGWLTAWDYGSGPTVLLVHGWSGAAAQWSRFVEPLVRAGYNAVALDMPAHGFSDGDRTNLKEFVEAIVDTAQRVRPIRAVVAHSLGATAAILALGRGLRAQRAVLVAPPARDVPGFVHSFAQRLGLTQGQEGRLVARMRRRFGDLEQFDARRVAATLDTPALVFHDVDDAEIPFAEGESLARAWPGARMRPLAGLSHNRPLKDPEVVREALAFIAAPERSRLVSLPSVTVELPRPV